MKKRAAKNATVKKKTREVLLLAKRIKSLRVNKGFTSYDYFAYEKGISRSQYGRYEQGEDIRFISLMKVIKAFDMSPKEFFSEGFEEL